MRLKSFPKLGKVKRGKFFCATRGKKQTQTIYVVVHAHVWYVFVQTSFRNVVHLFNFV